MLDVVVALKPISTTEPWAVYCVFKNDRYSIKLSARESSTSKIANRKKIFKKKITTKKIPYSSWPYINIFFFERHQCYLLKNIFCRLYAFAALAHNVYMIYTKFYYQYPLLKMYKKYCVATCAFGAYTRKEIHAITICRGICGATASCKLDYNES